MRPRMFDHADKATKRAAVHCQICLQHAAPAALPPPSGASLPLPIVQCDRVRRTLRAETPPISSGAFPVIRRADLRHLS